MHRQRGVIGQKRAGVDHRRHVQLAHERGQAPGVASRRSARRYRPRRMARSGHGPAPNAPRFPATGWKDRRAASSRCSHSAAPPPPRPGSQAASHRSRQRKSRSRARRFYRKPADPWRRIRPGGGAYRWSCRRPESLLRSPLRRLCSACGRRGPIAIVCRPAAG